MTIKEKLIEKISRIRDESILEEVMEIIDLELELTSRDIVLSKEQKLFIDEGLQDIESGNLITDKEAKKLTKEWLKKR